MFIEDIIIKIFVMADEFRKVFNDISKINYYQSWTHLF